MTRLIDTMRAATLDAMAHDVPAREILHDLCLALEQHMAGTVAGATILDRAAQSFEHAIFPSLSPEYAEGLKGARVAAKPGTCALAVFDGETVVCEDVANDPRFHAGWKALSLAHGLRALVSVPAMHRDGIALGTLVVAYPPTAPLDAAGRALAEEAAGLCALVLTYRRTQLAHELMIGELQHRVRNLFSAIGAVVYSTLRAHPEPEAFRKTFDGRLAAMAKAHALALECGEIELRQLLVDTLAPYAVDHAVSIEGPAITLSREAAVAFSLAAHELATNAAKYGAFATSTGAVRVRWDLEREEAASRFRLVWQEEGGPPVEVPRRLGFGQKTLRRSLESALDAQVSLEYQPAGLRCLVSAPHSPRLGATIN